MEPLRSSGGDFPAGTRATGDGIAAATGKIGGFFGVFLFPSPMKAYGLPGAEWMAAIASTLGLVVTWTMLPESKGRSLE